MFQNNSYSRTLTQKIDDFGIISLMYHRFEENKYPSTNIRINEFYHNILNYSSQDKTAEEKIKIRDDYINNKIQEILLPYMIYMKIVLQNNDPF